MIVKAGLGLIGLSAVSVGGVALAKPSWLGMGKDPMPSWHSLSEDNGYPDSDYVEGKFGKKYGKYLVGIKHKGNETEETNKDWWEWSFRRIDKEGLNKGKFKELKSANNNGADALKKLCEEAYKKTPGELKDDSDNTITDNDFKKSNVWKYCSPGKLTTTSEGTNTDSYHNTQIGGEDGNKTKLISVKNSANDWFWEIRNKDFWSKEASNELSGLKATNGDQSKQSIFKEEYEKNKDNGISTARQTIKKLCEEAYKLTKNEKESNNTDANRFCKLETN